jgi:hypothetical protein
MNQQIHDDLTISWNFDIEWCSGVTFIQVSTFREMVDHISRHDRTDDHLLQTLKSVFTEIREDVAARMTKDTKGRVRVVILQPARTHTATG